MSDQHNVHVVGQCDILYIMSRQVPLALAAHMASLVPSFCSLSGSPTLGPLVYRAPPGLGSWACGSSNACPYSTVACSIQLSVAYPIIPYQWFCNWVSLGETPPHEQLFMASFRVGYWQIVKGFLASSTGTATHRDFTAIQWPMAFPLNKV